MAIFSLRMTLMKLQKVEYWIHILLQHYDKGTVEKINTHIFALEVQNKPWLLVMQIIQAQRSEIDLLGCFWPCSWGHWCVFTFLAKF